ncbi:DUF4145 domain-containing protein [Pectinatus frisingensis]|uniref:DUF4145 domain-containing protein n=1 Tax=Pectinatus frisingensis TaxID=865 RepID=UPI0018C7AF31|nr:DUF4145 domain-containing protein [Pectinatus frisingensis]
MNKYIEIDKRKILIDLPSICPNCRKGIFPLIIKPTLSYTKYSYTDILAAALILKCPDCEQLFFAEYIYIENYDVWKIINVYPSSKPKIDIPPKINEYYPEFYEIYVQAVIAEANGLNHVCGMAYRKAIEFLVKSYLIELYPDNKDMILKETLMQSINRIKYDKIKALAKAATWLGNDQTHILQKHPDYNMEDIKNFTIALCHLILSEKVADKALTLTQK